MSLDHAILGFLSEKPITGYDLKTRCFDETASHFWTADQAQVYRTLERLENRKFVRPRLERQHSRPDRKVYSATPAGISELHRWITSGGPAPPLRDPFLIRLRFAEGVSDDELLGLLGERRQEMQARLESLRTQTARPLPADAQLSAILERLTLDAAIAHARSSIDWLDDCTETLLSRREPDSFSRSGDSRPLPPLGEKGGQER